MVLIIELIKENAKLRNDMSGMYRMVEKGMRIGMDEMNEGGG